MADFELKINPAGLETAAGKYSTASGKFSDTVGNLQKELNSALSVWEDSATEGWNTKVTNACTDLTAINDLLTANSTALNEIAAYAKASEEAVKQGINSL